MENTKRECSEREYAFSLVVTSSHYPFMLFVYGLMLAILLLVALTLQNTINVVLICGDYPAEHMCYNY